MKTINKATTIRAAFAAAAIAATAAIPMAASAAAKQVTLTLSGYEGTTTLANFQALVKLTEGRYGFSHGARTPENIRPPARFHISRSGLLTCNFPT